MDFQRDHEEFDPWLLSTNLRNAHVDLFDQSRSLWYAPNVLDEDDEDAANAMAITHEQLADPEEQLFASIMNFQKTTSRATPMEGSPSARTYQTTQLSARELSKHSMSIRSQSCRLFLSRKPHPPQEAPSLTSWTPTASLIASKVNSTNSASREMERKPGPLKRLMGSIGTPLTRTSSRSSTREIAKRVT
nr:movement protein [Carrot polerovirus 1]